ncbi:ABC transporter ATP-binding protein [Aeromicrobium sp. CTD01-1L150]|uniref:ABC transporter ATP-binding protein n=1 Tax=Aeromicrobium sp. CTD01-1L150 TaxID=3341830 RepID=UPI0035C13077
MSPAPEGTVAGPDAAVHQLLPVADARATTALAWRLVRARVLSLVLTVISFLAAGFAGIVPVLMIGRIVDTVRDGGTTAEVTTSVVVMVAAGLAAGLFTTASAAALAQSVAPALAELREDVLDRALHLDSERIEAAGAGDVLGRVSDDVRRLTEALDEAIPMLLGAVAAIAFTVGGLFSLDWRLGLAGVGAAPFYVLALRWYLPRSAPFYRAERTAEGERADALVTGVRGAGTLRAFGAQDVALERIETRSREALDVTYGVFRLFTRFGSRMNWSECVGLLLVLATGYVLVRHDIASVGDATAAALFFHRLFNPIGAVLFVFDSVQASGAALARLAGVALLPTPGDEDSNPGTAATLELRGVHHEYEAGLEVLAPLDLSVPRGERLAVVGATGAGKTTLGGIAAGVLTPTGGTVHLGDLDVLAVPEPVVRRHVALVSQEVHVFAGTVRDNLVLADTDATDDVLWQALRATDAEAWVRALPDALETRIGDLGHPLTPAQAQQLALARVLVLDPAMVVLDEATAEAGSSGARELERAALAVTRGRTSIVIAHRLTQARAADRVLVMDEGRVVQAGTHDQLVTTDGPYARLWEAWNNGQ